ncbi:MAG TPA: arylesterase [Candidatus Polarisedimenticolaceae bacterium]|nr:arylesterase [Candidatus Polarisedimenticolaceae bacterium]
MRGAAVVMVVVYLTTIACANSQERAPEKKGIVPPTADAPLVIFLGDSLTAGFGLAQDEAFPALVGEMLGASGHPIRVVNAGVSGDTTGDGLARLDWLLKQSPRVIVVGLGANDAFRGQDPGEAERNLQDIVARSKATGARVLLLGMKIPPSYGQVFARGYGEIYARVAKEEKVPLVPFLLEGVGGRADLNQDDGIHPNAQGQRIVAKTVAPHLEKIVAELR